MRVFRGGTRDLLVPGLRDLPVNRLPRLGSQEDYRVWYESSLEVVSSVLEHHNAENPRVNPGLKWGHATKILSIYVAGIVLWSRYFQDAEVRRLEPWLYCPIDSKVMERLEALGTVLGFSRIKDISSPDQFYYVQQALGKAASKVGVPRIWFDDNWALGDPDHLRVEVP
jgi:hypothetical protein